MNMNDDQASLLQDHLYLLHLSGYSPDLLIGGRGRVRDNEHWQYAVNLVYSGLGSGVLGLHSEGWMLARGMKSHHEFVLALATHDPFSQDFFENGSSIYWLEPEIYLSNEYDELISRYGIQGLGQRVETGLVNEVLQVFENSGVEWGTGPEITF